MTTARSNARPASRRRAPAKITMPVIDAALIASVVEPAVKPDPVGVDPDPAVVVETAPTEVAEEVAVVESPQASEPATEDTTAAMVEPRPAGRVVTVFSPKGGAGKTVMSTNIAVALAAGGARSVCLVDLDLEFGDVAITVGLAPSKSMIDAVDQDPRLDDDRRVEALITSWLPGLDAVLAPIDPAGAERISPAVVASVIQSLKSRYDYVVIDTPPNLSEAVLEALDAADHHVLVTTPEIPALKNLRLTLDVLDLLGYVNVRRAVVLNRFDAKAGMGVEDVAAALDTAVTAIVPASPQVSASVNAGSPLSQSDPKHPVSVAVRELVTRDITGTTVAAGKQSSLFGLKLRTRTS